MANPALTALAIILVFAGVILLIVSVLPSDKTDTKWAIGGFIGPIPFGFGSDKKIIYITLAIGIVLFLTSIVISYITSKSF